MFLALIFLSVWIVSSVPAAVLVGRMIAAGSAASSSLDTTELSI